LLVELVGFLRGRGCGVQHLQLELYHRYAAHSQLPIGLVSPSRDAEHLGDLLREHLSRFALPAPVEALGLRTEALMPLTQHSDDLFARRNAEHVDWPQLCERLQARLGSEAVRSVCTVAEYRPEYAWRYCAPGEAETQAPPLPRPSWLLNEPLALHLVEGQPWLEGPLQLVQGPERIESGWWDGHDVRRDYFIAESMRHARYWIYRELPQARAWYLHGLFG
jgi:protein ImuB